MCDASTTYITRWRVAPQLFPILFYSMQPLHASSMHTTKANKKHHTHPRVARVVAWLERLAAERLDRSEAYGSSDRFGPNDGVWRETRARVGASAAAGLPAAGARDGVLGNGGMGK